MNIFWLKEWKKYQQQYTTHTHCNNIIDMDVYYILKVQKKTKIHTHTNNDKLIE